MYFLLSPAKNLNEKVDAPTQEFSHATLLEHAEELVKILKEMAPQQLSDLMGISDKIARLNMERNQNWQQPFTLNNAKQAVFMFNGDVYEGLDAHSLSDKSLQYLQQHLGLLSGLYGILRPLDLIQPYRLEMGSALNNPRGKDLYEFWGDIITNTINQRLAENNDKLLINLASKEYFKSVRVEKLNAKVITPVFKDEKNGVFKIISFYAKRARGLMMRYAAEHRISQVEQLKNFNSAGYCFNETASSSTEWVFLRKSDAKS